jgi:hypothetical protein
MKLESNFNILKEQSILSLRKGRQEKIEKCLQNKTKKYLTQLWVDFIFHVCEEIKICEKNINFVKCKLIL